MYQIQTTFQEAESKIAKLVFSEICTESTVLTTTLYVIYTGMKKIATLRKI